MQKRFTGIVGSCAVALTCVTTTAAQTPAPDRIVVASPTYRLASFTRALEKMKILAEGGTLPPR